MLMPPAQRFPAGELLFGFVEENGNKAGTVGGRFINATRTAGQTIIIPQGNLGLPDAHKRLHDGHACTCTNLAYHAMSQTGLHIS